MLFLGLPDSVTQELAGKTDSNNLIAVTSPMSGEVVARTAVTGEIAQPSTVLFTIADTSKMLLTLHVRLEDANRLQPGQVVQFQHAGHATSDDGRVAWISPTADEKSRTVAVRVEMPNPSGLHHANTFGTAQVIMRDEPDAVVVPSSAVHWEGDCNVVFVRDKNFEKADGLKVFHVRKVRPGAQSMDANNPLTEIAAGLLPGEYVATANSGILRTELLKNNLGEG
jgi:cobalt-zinc-cadmium efflux system membrane fusion protein